MNQPISIDLKAFKRFILRVVEADSGCWEWTSSRHEADYGEISLNGRTIRTHRFSWVAYFGQIPEGLHVLHRCDNPPCVRPDHLFLGTDADNIRDKIAKGRWKGNLKGTPKNLKSFRKLTESQVAEIRLLANSMTIRAIAKQFGMGRMAIWSIIHRETWKQVA